MDEQKNYRVTLYVLNNFLKFERKLYTFLGIPIGRSIKMKSALYFLIFAAIEGVIYFTPIIGATIRWLPFIFLLLIPGLLSYLLSAIRTEGRIPLAFFRSVFLYNLRRIKKVTYIRGREIAKPYIYKFNGYSTITFAEDRADRVFKPKKVKFKMKANITDFFNANEETSMKGELN